MSTYYHCSICGNIFEAIHFTGNVPTCCDQPMECLKPASTDGAHEKHVPIYTIENDILTVNVGELPHPMETDHYIQWIALCTNLGYYRKALHPGDNPTVTFCLCKGEKPKNVYAYCNLHGLWEAH